MITIQNLFVPQVLGDDNVYKNDFESDAGFSSSASLVSETGGRGGSQVKLSGSTQMNVSCSEDFTAEFSVYLTDTKGNWIIELIDNTGVFGNAAVLGKDGSISSCYPAGSVGSYEIGKWYRFAVEVETGTQNYNLYIDGKKIDTSGKILSNSATALNFDKLDRIKITNNGSPSSLYMDDLVIYKGAYKSNSQSTLSSDKFKISGETIYASDTTLTAEKLLEGLSSSGTLKLYSDPAYFSEIAASDKIGRISYLIEYTGDGTMHYYTVLCGSLQMYYSFDGATVDNSGNVTFVRDETGNGFDGEISGTPTLADSDISGKSIVLSGVTADTEIIKVKNSENSFVYNASDCYTMSVWVKRNQTAIDDWKGIIIKGKAVNTNTNSNYYGLWNANNVNGGKAPYAFSGAYKTSDMANMSGINIFNNTNSEAEKWTHLAAVQNNSTITFYTDGKAVGSAAAKDIANSGHPLYIGGVNPGYKRQFFGGEIDDVGIFDYALSASEIAELANKKSPKQIDKEALNSDCVKYLKTKADEIKALPLGVYTAESAQKLNSSLDNCDKIISSSATADINKLISDVRYALLDLTAAEQALTELPSLQMHLDFSELENGSASDITGNGFNASAVGSSPEIVNDEERGSVASLDGTQIFKVNNSENNFVYNKKDSYTMSIWIKPQAEITEWKGIAVKGREAGSASNTKNYYGMWIGNNISGKNPYAYSGKQGTKGINIFANTSAATGKWTNLVIVQDGEAETITFYIDGAACSTILKTDDMDNTGHALYVGGANETMSNQRIYGLIDDFCVFNYAVGSEGISALASGKSPEDVHQSRLTYDAAQILLKEIAEAEKISEDDYTESGMADFKAALAKAKAAASALESVEAIENAASLLSAAKAALVKKQVIAGWIFEESSKSFNDISGSGYNISSSQTITVKDGLKKTAAQLFGQGLEAANSSELSINGDFMLAALINPSNALNGSIIKKGAEWNLYIENNMIKFSSGGSEKVSSAIASNKWSYVLIEKVNDKLYMYINNTLKAAADISNSINSNQSVIVGDGYSGLLEDLRLYNYGANDAEREKLYKRAAYFVPQNEWLPSLDNPKLIFDTDFGGDVDDVGALAMIHSYVQRDMAELLAVIVNRANCSDTAAAIDAINTYYGSPDIPIGINENEIKVNGASNYGWYLSQYYENDIYHNYYAEKALDVYRRTLADAEDNSVTIVITGHMTNLANLLKSGADKYSSLTGTELVAKKVKFISMMGGGFTPTAYQPEHNIVRDLASSTYVIENSPVKILFSGYEIGNAYLTAGKRKLLGDDHPLKIAYDLYLNDTSNATRPSYDQTSVIAAVEGLGDYWDIKIGTCSVDDKGYVTFDEDGYSNHAYLTMKKSAGEMADYIDELMMDAKHDNPDEKVMNIIDDSNSSISYSGSFTQGAGGKLFIGDSCKKTTTIGDSLETEFYGSRVEIFGIKGPDAGKIEVFIDGVSQGIFDMYQSFQAYGVPIFQSGELENGKHTLKASLVSDKNEASSSNAFYFDCIKAFSDYKIDIQKDENNNASISIKQFSKNGTLYAAVFDEQSNLISVKLTRDTEYGRHTIALSADEIGKNSVRAFYWSDMIPLTK